jgi:hypothetical protein
MRLTKAGTESLSDNDWRMRRYARFVTVLALVACAEDVTSGPLDPIQAPALTPNVSAAVVSEQVRKVGSKPVSGETSGAVVAMRKLRGLPADSITKWRAGLDRLAKVSRHKEASVALSRIILDAVTASTDVEYRTKIAQLPVTITDSAGLDAAGRVGTYRNYSVYGKTRISVFRPTAGDTDETPLTTGSGSDSADPGLTEDESTAAAV